MFLVKCGLFLSKKNNKRSIRKVLMTSNNKAQLQGIIMKFLFLEQNTLSGYFPFCPWSDRNIIERLKRNNV